MNKWVKEYSHIIRYIGSGALNTIVGFGIIFLMMSLGFSPFLANICGYLAGFILGFFVTKKFVFNSKDPYFSEGLKYLIAFLACFLLNFLVLNIAIRVFHINALISQIFAAVTYTLSMYLILRYFVFLNRKI